MPALDFGLPLRSSPKPSASPSHYAEQQTATSGPKLIATDGPRILAKRNATPLAESYPPGGPLWSLSDLTIEILAAVRTSHTLLAKLGYLGDASVYLSADPGGGQLYEERGGLPFIRHTSSNRQPPAMRWTAIVPKPPGSSVKREVSCFVPSNFSSRTERLETLVADLLNQLLRDLGYGAVLGKLREYVTLIAQSPSPR